MFATEDTIIGGGGGIQVAWPGNLGWESGFGEGSVVKREVVGVSHQPVGSAEVCITIYGDGDPSYCGSGGIEPIGYPCIRRRDVGRREHFCFSALPTVVVVARLA